MHTRGANGKWGCRRGLEHGRGLGMDMVEIGLGLGLIGLGLIGLGVGFSRTRNRRHEMSQKRVTKRKEHVTAQRWRWMAKKIMLLTRITL